MTSTETRSTYLDSGPSATWYRQATRWTQVTFTDDDPTTFDLDFWVDVMKRTHSNALCVSAGGYMAFYPTQVPFHHRSQNLRGTDPFGALVGEARKLGMKVMARVDPHAVHRDAAEAHPEWLARDEHGNAVEHGSMPGTFWTDPFSTYLSEHITEIAREITRDYDVDALFANRWETVKGVSYSEPVARAFRADTGYALPLQRNLADPAWAAYSQWRSRRFSELVGIWDDAVRTVKPHVRFIPNRGPGITRDLVRSLIEDRYPMFVVDKQGRWGDEPAWTSGRIGKRARGLYPERPLALLSSVGSEDHSLRWKDSVTSPDELRSYIVDGFVHGGRPWFSKFKATLFDTRWITPVVEAFDLHRRCERVMEEFSHTAEVALLDARRPDGPTPWLPAEDSSPAHEDGVYQALLEARIPFEYVADETLSPERLEGIRVLVIASGAALSPEHTQILESFVAGGGSIVACYDATAVPVSAHSEERQFLLGKTLGVRLRDDVRGPVKNNYITIDGAHPVLSGFDGAQRIVGGTSVLGVENATEAEVVSRFIPDYPDLPMEEVYPRSYDGPPAVVAREHQSGGRTVYIAFNIGEIYWKALQADHARLLTNSVRWALGDCPQRVRVTGDGLVDIALHEAPGELAISLVNLTSAMAMRGQNHGTIPLGEQQIEARLPDGATGATARALISDRPLEVTVTDGIAHLGVEGLTLLEVINLTWS